MHEQIQEGTTWSLPCNLPYKEGVTKILSCLGSWEPDVLHSCPEFLTFGHIFPRLALRPVLPWLAMEVKQSYSVSFKQGCNQKAMYLCFLGLWKIFPNLPLRLPALSFAGLLFGLSRTMDKGLGAGEESVLNSGETQGKRK